jgi:cytoskeletal protein CcmA (bactofilin family)
MSEYINIQQQDFSFLGEGSTMSGKFVLRGTTRISSKIDGEISMCNEADLVIEHVGSFEGQLNCHNVEIYGNFKGVLNATGKVSIFPPAIVEGNITAKALKILPGASLNFDAHTTLD